MTNALADEISLANYIDRANQSGINIIYSSAVLPGHLKVNYDPEKAPGVEGIRRALLAYGFDLEAVNESTWVVVVREQPPKPLPPEQPKPVFEPLSIEEVVVSSSRYRLMGASPNRPQLLDGETLSLRAATANDALRVVNQLPGSATVGISARPRVRGGLEDETLILFDGIRLYNPFHFNRFNNLFSSFDSRVISSIDFYSGGFPVSMGDRLSATMAIQPRTKAELEHPREVGLGLFHLSYLQGVDLDHGDIFFSFRRSNFELLDSLAENDFGRPAFADMFLRYHRPLNSGADWNVSLLWFGDDIDINDSDNSESSESIYGNVYLWSTLERETENRYSKSRIGLARVKNDREGTLDRVGQVTGEINDNQTFHFYFLGQDHEWNQGDSLLGFGWDYRYLEADYESFNQQLVAPAYVGLSNITRSPIEIARVNETGHQGAIYGNWKQQVLSDLTLELGVRVDAQHYESSRQDEQFSFRLGALYEPTSHAQIRLAVGEYAQAQGVNELNVSDLEFDFQPAQTATHVIAGLDYYFDKPALDFKVEAYRKFSSDPRTYYQNLAQPFTLLSELQPDRVRIDTGGFEAKGIELSLNGHLSGGEWWLNYSYATVRDRLAGKNLRRSWDQERSFNLGYHKNWRGWDISSSVAFHEGWLTTPLKLQNGLVVAGTRNSQRFEHFISFDIKGKKSWKLGQGNLRLEVGLTNLFNRENQVGVDYVLEGGALVDEPEYGLPLAPFVDVYWAF